MKMLITFAMFALFAAACGGSGQVVKVEPKPAPVAVADNKEVSPERQAFADCYRELACRINLDYDPLDDYATIHEPVEQLKMMVENDDTRIKYYLPILARHGYASAKAFLEKDQWFKEAVPVWWEKQRAGLLNLMAECKKK
ncbi:MAG: hypothetical protein ABIK09_09305 [Pseudomonadota bacterium]